jgi:hypothetical protein
VYTIVSAPTLDEAAVEDLQAIRRLKRGHLDGLESLMRRHQLKAARAAFLITHDQDLVQEFFLRLYQRIHQFDEAYPFEPYLMRSVVNASLEPGWRLAGDGQQITVLVNPFTCQALRLNTINGSVEDWSP